MKKVVFIIAIAIVVIIAGILLFLTPAKTNVEALDAPASTNTKSDAHDETITNALSGTVLDGITKKPIAAKITVKDKKQILKSTDCNASGEYSFALPYGKYQLSAEFPGYVPLGKFDISHPIEIDENTQKLKKIYLWPEAKVKGHVISENSGIAAQIQFNYQYDDSDAENYIFKNLTSDAEGNFLLTQAYGGIQDITITADGYVAQTLKDIELDPGKTVDLGDIPMRTGTTIFGTVTDSETAKAIAGAKLQYIDNHGNVLLQTTSQEDGSYKLPATDLQNIQIAITADGYKDIRDAISTNGQARYEYNPAMSKLAGIGIVVNNQTGREPIKTLITVTDIATEKVVYEKEHDNGFYTLNALQQGPYLVHGYSADKLTEATARVTAGSTATLTLKPFAKLNVQFVLKRDNSPAKGTYRYIYKSDDAEEMTTNWTPIPTDTDTVLIDNLMPGTYQIEARSDSFWEASEGKPGETHISRSAQIPLQMGETRFVKLPLTTGGTMRGKFIIPPRLAGKPIIAMVYRDFKDENEQRSRSGTTVMVDPNGEFIADQLPEGEFSIYAFTPTGDASYFSGIKVNFDGDLAMDFDMNFSRKETEDGIPLMMPRPSWTDEEFQQMSDEEKREKLPPFLQAMDNWGKALQNQEQYQQSAAQERAELEIDEAYEN